MPVPALRHPDLSPLLPVIPSSPAEDSVAPTHKGPRAKAQRKQSPSWRASCSLWVSSLGPTPTPPPAEPLTGLPSSPSHAPTAQPAESRPWATWTDLRSLCTNAGIGSKSTARRDWGRHVAEVRNPAWPSGSSPPFSGTHTTVLPLSNNVQGVQGRLRRGLAVCCVQPCTRGVRTGRFRTCKFGHMGMHGFMPHLAPRRTCAIPPPHPCKGSTAQRGANTELRS